MSPAEERFYFKELRVQQYRALTHLSKHGSFEAAGQALGLSRASVWRQVRSLEREVGCTLVSVQGRAVALTCDGQLLAELVLPFMDDFEQILPEFRTRRATEVTKLTVASTPTLLIHELPQPVRALRQRHPDLDLRLSAFSSCESLGHLMRDEADVAVIGRLDEDEWPTELLCEPLTSYPFMLLLPRGHALSRVRKIELRHVIGTPLILPSSNLNSRPRIDAVLRQAGMNQRVRAVLETNTCSTALPYLRLGIGALLMSLSPNMVAGELTELRDRGEIEMRSMVHLFGEERVYFVTKKVRAHRPCVADFKELLVRVLRNG